MVRADRNGAAFDAFRSEAAIGIGWGDLGDLAELATRDAIAEAYEQTYPSKSAQAVGMDVGQIDRFVNRFAEGDQVVTYDPSRRMYACGVISGPYVYDPEAEVRVLTNRRAVTWQHETSRDDLSAPARTSLGSISTIFAIRGDVATELWKPQTPIAEGGEPAPASDDPDHASSSVSGDDADQAPDLELLANEAIKDMVSSLSWQEMQELVAGLLRAMGFKTRVSPSGPDRGKDVIASPDGFGFREPRIFAEVKHRKGQAGSQEVRSFLGGRRPGDTGLYVSTGGFSKDAYYEAERANIPTTLMNIDDLVHAVQEYYGSFDSEAKQILPLKPLFAPYTFG